MQYPNICAMIHKKNVCSNYGGRYAGYDTEGNDIK